MGELLYKFRWIVLGVAVWGNLDAQVFHDTYFRQQAYVGMDYLYNMEFESAEKVFQQLEHKYSDHPAPYFLLAMNRWWQTYVCVDMTTYHNYIHSQLVQAIELNSQFEKAEGYELEYTFFQFMNYAFKARLHTLRREWWKGANAGRKALPYLKDGFDFVGQSPEFYFGSGIYHYFADTYVEDHPYVKPLMIFFPGGDGPLGIKELEAAAAERNFAQVEAMFYLADIYLDEEAAYEEGKQLYLKLHQRYPQNTWFEMGYNRALVLAKNYPSAERRLRVMVAKFEGVKGHTHTNITTLVSPYTSLLMTRVYYYLGRLLYEKGGAVEEGVEYLEKSLRIAQLIVLEDDIIVPETQFYLGLAYDRLGQREKAIQSYKQVLKLDQNRKVKKRTKECLHTPCK